LEPCLHHRGKGVNLNLCTSLPNAVCNGTFAYPQTDASGQKLSMSHSVYFGHDHTKHIKPTPEDMKRFIRVRLARTS
jgi:hypothetical protein